MLAILPSLSLVDPVRVMSLDLLDHSSAAYLGPFDYCLSAKMAKSVNASATDTSSPSLRSHTSGTPSAATTASCPHLRVQNALIRRWAQSYRNLPTLNPAQIDWLKDNDTDPLYATFASSALETPTRFSLPEYSNSSPPSPALSTASTILSDSSPSPVPHCKRKGILKPSSFGMDPLDFVVSSLNSRHSAVSPSSITPTQASLSRDLAVAVLKGIISPSEIKGSLSDYSILPEDTDSDDTEDPDDEDYFTRRKSVRASYPPLKPRHRFRSPVGFASSRSSPGLAIPHLRIPSPHKKAVSSASLLASPITVTTSTPLVSFSTRVEQRLFLTSSPPISPTILLPDTSSKPVVDTSATWVHSSLLELLSIRPPRITRMIEYFDSRSVEVVHEEDHEEDEYDIVAGITDLVALVAKGCLDGVGRGCEEVTLWGGGLFGWGARSREVRRKWVGY